MQTCDRNETMENLQFYLEHTNEHTAILQSIQDVLTGEFQRIGAEKHSLDVLGVGSGGGELDIKLLTLLQSTHPSVVITADIVEVSSELTDNFKALVAKSPTVQIPFTWHIMKSKDYMKQVQAKGNMKRFDFIHMIQMIYYVENLTDTIKFYHSLLKDNGTLMIIVEMNSSGWTTLWNTYQEELVDSVKGYDSEMVIASLKSLGLKYEEHVITNSFDITECFNPHSQTGNRVLNFLTEKENFYESFTPDTRADMLDLLQNKCGVEKDGKIVFNSNLSCLLVHA